MKRESWKKLWPFMKVERETTADLRVVGDLTVLRSKIMDDAEADYSWRIDPELARLDATRPVTLTFGEYMRYHRDDVSYPSPWSVRMAIDTLDGRHIGNCMYYDINNDQSQCELGIMIGNREYWGRGYGTDVVKSALSHIFTATTLKRVYLHTLVDNLRAQRSFAKAGFKAVREVTSLGLREAKELVESSPTKVKEGVTKDDAESVKTKLEEAGATVSIK